MVRTASIIVVLVMNIAPALAAPGAGPPRLEIGAPTGAELARAGLVLRVRSELTRADLMLTFTTDASAEQEAAATFDLPHGARIVGMSFQTGDGSPMLARPMADAVAARAFDRIAHHFRKDPALLQLREEADARDRYSLRVYPLTASAPTTASIQIELPAARTLQLASAAPIEHVEVQIDGASEVFALTEPHAITLPEPVYTYDERPSRPLVTEALALFADDPARAPMLAGRVDVDLLVNPSATSDTRDLRPLVRRRLFELQTCFRNEQTVVGGVTLRFAVVPGGHVAGVSIDGAGSQQVSDCVAQQVAQWGFKQSDADGVRLVAYPVFWERS